MSPACTATRTRRAELVAVLEHLAQALDIALRMPEGADERLAEQFYEGHIKPLFDQADAIAQVSGCRHCRYRAQQLRGLLHPT